MSKSSIRIILVIGDLATAAAGPNALVRRLSAWLVSHGYDVTVVGTYRGLRPSVEEIRSLHGWARIAMHRRYLKETWHFSPGVLRLAASLLLSKDAFVVELHSPWLFNGIMLSFVAKLRRQKFFVKLAGGLRPVALSKNKTTKVVAMALFLRRWLRWSAGLIALNETEKTEAMQIVPGASFYVIPNGVRPCSLAPSPTRRKEVLFLGRIDPVKNLEHLIEGFSLMDTEFPDWTLRIVGPAADPRYLQRLKSLPAVRSLGNRICFNDAAYGDEKQNRLLSASLFALTSWSEGQPNAVLEAMAHGLPVLVSDQCNIDVPPQCGRVCGCTPAEIAKSLGDLISMSEDQHEHLQSQAMNYVLREFHEETAFQKRLCLYLSRTGQDQCFTVPQ